MRSSDAGHRAATDRPGTRGAVRAGARRATAALVLAAALGSGCDVVRAPDAPRTGTLVNTVSAEAANARSGAVGRVPFLVPDTLTIPEGDLGASVRRGRALVSAPRDSFPGRVRSTLRCTSCHLDGGTRRDVMPWVGVAARFPQYRPRSGAVVSLEERVRGCFSRSLNATPPAHGSRDLVDITAYLTWLSRGTPMGRETEGQGLPVLEPHTPDRSNGRAVFVAQCARCHGARGEGGRSAAATVPDAPPLWGSRSYNVGAGMARVSIAANFIRAAMPYDRPGTLTPQEAYDVAAYINAQPRPDFAAKANDWPRGDAPADAAYRTRAQAATRRR